MPKTSQPPAAKTVKLHTAFVTTSPGGVIVVHVNNLRINPALNVVPMMGTVAAHLLSSKTPQARQAGADLMAEKEALWATWDAAGEVDAVKAHLATDGCYEIDDGRHRLEWALARGRETLRVEPVTAEAGALLAEATVIGRRHWTKGQRAYLGVLSHPEVAGMKHGGNRKDQTDAIGLIASAPDLAERLGVSADTVLQAVELYRLFHAPGFKAGSPEAIEAADRKERYEMSIWAGAGLGGVIAGIGGGNATGDKPRAASGFHGLDKPLAALVRFSGVFTKWDADERAKAQKLMVARFRTDMTPEFRLMLAEALAAADS
jgi:hypothetical protein